MIRLIWTVSVHTRYFLRRYMPTNILLDAIRTHRRGLKWGIPEMLLAVPYIPIANVCVQLIDPPHSAAVHVESRRQLPHGQPIGVTGDQLGSIGDAQTGLRLPRVLTHRTALIGHTSTPSPRPTSPRTP